MSRTVRLALFLVGDPDEEALLRDAGGARMAVAASCSIMART